MDKIFVVLLGMCLSSAGYSADNRAGKVCKVTNMNDLNRVCKAGDIAVGEVSWVPYVCDYRKQIVVRVDRSRGQETFSCSYIGFNRSR